MRLLTKFEVKEIIRQSLTDCQNTKGYRFGQAIYNNLPVDVAQAINGSSEDMFHVKDDDLAYTMLLNLAEKM
jgi:hypothetical protein